MDRGGSGSGGSFASNERSLWVAAVVLYGVGDTTTTLWGLSTSGVSEGGVVLAPLVTSHGWVALLVTKVAVFVTFYAVWRVLRTPGRTAVPLALAFVGGVVSVWNVYVVLGG